MKAYSLRIFGITVVQFDIVDLDMVPVEEVVEAEDEETPTEIGGGSAHNFSIDEAPFAPEDQFADDWSEDRRVKLGFQLSEAPSASRRVADLPAGQRKSGRAPGRSKS